MMQRNLLCILMTVAVVSLAGLPAAFAQDQGVSQDAIDDFKEVKEAAQKEKIEVAVQKDATGTDPRSFTNKWMPYYRHTELENGLTQQVVTANGIFGFSDRVGVFYEVPLSQYVDTSDATGLPPSKAIGMGNVDLKFLIRPSALEFRFGENGKKGASFLLGTNFVFPTATDDALGGNAFLFAPIVGFVCDMPLHGFIAALNIYYFDVHKDETASETSRYVGKWFYMQPLTPPGAWWGGFFLLPEFQPVYDFETEEFSSWIGVELGKMVAPGKIAYIKPGWGIDNSELVDRKATTEVGFRWFF
jgi:hypothetical protein